MEDFQKSFDEWLDVKEKEARKKAFDKNGFMVRLKPEDSQGGYLLPETFITEVERGSVLFAGVRGLGSLFLRFGVWLKSLGYAKKEMRLNLREMMESKRIEEK